MVALTAPENTVRVWIAGGNGPSTVMPGRFMSSESCWNPSATLPSATSDPTGTPGGGTTMRARIDSSIPQRSNSFSRYTPLGPVE